MIVDKSNYNNNWYKPGPLWKRIFWFYTSVIFFQNGWFPQSSLKVFLLRIFGAKVGVGVTLKPFVTIKYPWFLIVGDYVGIGEGVWIDNLALVTLGNQVTISQGALLLTGNHDFNSQVFELKLGEIKVSDGAWIGAKTVVCPGLTIGSHALLTVGSVATKSLEPYKIYSGNPAEYKKDRIISATKSK